MSAALVKPTRSKRTMFQDNCMKLVDQNGTLISKWTKKDSSDQYYCICIICNSLRFNIEKGFDRLRQHAKSEKHISNLSKLDSGQLLLRISSKPTETFPFSIPEVNNNHGVKEVSVYNSKEGEIRAELLWCIENAVSHNSVTSCSVKKELFNEMFPGGVPENFTLSPSKAQYIITEALGPYFKDLFLKDLESENVLF